MTLLESLVALVILGLAAVGFLEAFQVTSHSTLRSEEWMHGVGYAEESMEQTKLGAAGPHLPAALPEGFVRDVAVQPEPGLRGVNRVTVTVALPGGRTFVLHRLVRAP